MFKFLVSLIVLLFSHNTPDVTSTNIHKVPGINEELFHNIYEAPNILFIEPEDDQNQANNDNHPNTNKITAYNTKSEKVIEKVAAVAVEKSPILIAANPTPTPVQEPPKEIPIPTIAPSPIPIKPPIPIDPPKPTIIPIPEPSVYPIVLPGPCYCPPKENCLMIACPEPK